MHFDALVGQISAIAQSALIPASLIRLPILAISTFIMEASSPGELGVVPVRYPSNSGRSSRSRLTRNN